MHVALIKENVENKKLYTKYLLGMQRSCPRPYRYTKLQKSQTIQSSRRLSSYEVSVNPPDSSSSLKLTRRSSVGIIPRARRVGEDDERDGLTIDGTLLYR